MSKLQPWLFDTLVASGVIDESGLNDRPQPRRCRGCGAPTLAAWRDGILEPVAVDPVELTPLGELQALTAGLATFEHWGGPNGGLDTRKPTSIAARPAGCQRAPVRPEHRCGSPPLDRISEPPSSDPYSVPPF